MTRLVCLLAALVLTSAPTLARAKKIAAPDQPPAARHFDFDDDLVETALSGPDHDLIDSLRKTRPSSLIRVRDSFLYELVRSGESI